MNLNFIKNLANSKTIQGIVVAAVGASIPAAKIAFPQYAPVIDAVLGNPEIAGAISGILSALGLGWAVNGRVNATGPITNEPTK